MLGCRCGDRFMWMFWGRGILYDVSECNVEIVVEENKEEIPLTRHGDIKGAVQG